MSEQAETIWTVGHSTHPLDEFLNILTTDGITMFADVRRFAGSRKHPRFIPDAFAPALTEAGIRYTAIPALGVHTGGAKNRRRADVLSV